MDPKRVADYIAEGALHLRCVIHVCNNKLEGGRHVLHEHAESAVLGQTHNWFVYSNNIV